MRDKRVRTAQWNVALVVAEGVQPFGCIDGWYPLERYEIGPMLHPPTSATSTFDELGDAVDNVEMLRVKLKRGESLSNDERRRQMRDEETVLASAPRLLELARSGVARQAMADEMGRIRAKVASYCWGDDRDPGQTDPGASTEALVSFVISSARDGDDRRAGHGMTLAELSLVHQGLSVIGEQGRVDLRLVDKWRTLLTRIGQSAAEAAAEETQG